MLSSRRLTAVTIGSLAISLGLWGVGYLPAATAALAANTNACGPLFTVAIVGGVAILRRRRRQQKMTV